MHVYAHCSNAFTFIVIILIIVLVIVRVIIMIIVIVIIISIIVMFWRIPGEACVGIEYGAASEDPPMIPPEQAPTC